MKRILVYGTTGVGKSALIKLVTGIQTIETGDSASGCTKDNSSYPFHFETEFTKSNRETNSEREKIDDFIFYDTAGLNETNEGTVLPSEAIQKLFNLVKSLRDGLNLIIYVRKKEPFSKIDTQNIELLKLLMKDKVPCLCVITGCEANMNWWEEEKKNTNVTQFKFKDGCSVCCIDISKLNNDEDKEFYTKKQKQSKQILMEKIKANLLPDPFKIYNDQIGFMIIFYELVYFFRHNKPTSWLCDNTYHDRFLQILKESGMDDEKANNMTKEMELNFK
jgi:hypothetical protein